MQLNPKYFARGLVGLLLLLVAIFLLIPSAPSPAWLPADVREEAIKAFRLAYQREPDRFDIVSVAAELAVRRDQLDLANQCFGDIPTDHPLYGPSARFQQAQVLLKLNLAGAAEQQLLEYLALPNIEFRRDAQQLLRYLLEIQLRFEERQVLLASMHSEGKLVPSDALFYGYASLLRWNGEQAVDRCRQFYDRDPENPTLRIAWAQYLGGTARSLEGLTLIESVLTQTPSNPHAVAVKLFLLTELGETETLAALVATLPPPERTDPWLMLRVRGQAALSRDDLDLAERCFRLYIENDPTLTECYFGLAEIAGKRGQAEQKSKLLETGRQLALIQNRLGGAQFAPGDPSPYLKLAEQSLAIGLKQQAQLAAESALMIDPQNAAAQAILQEIQP